jgi:putative transposase
MPTEKRHEEPHDMTPSEPIRKTCRRWDVPNQAHCLTFSCFQRRPFFRGKLAPGWFLESLDEARNRLGFELWAFVIMPEHVHLVVSPGEDYKISRILWQIKKPFSERVIRHTRETSPSFLPQMAEYHTDRRVAHRFWQPGGGYDRNLRSVEDVHGKIDYVHANPVRRGVVEQADEWPWFSYRAWNEGVDTPLRIDRDSLPPKLH